MQPSSKAISGSLGLIRKALWRGFNRLLMLTEVALRTSQVKIDLPVLPGQPACFFKGFGRLAVTAQIVKGRSQVEPGFFQLRVLFGSPLEVMLSLPVILFLRQDNSQGISEPERE